MDLKNTALKFWHTDTEEVGYGGPCLVKSGHMDILVRTRASSAMCVNMQMR